MKQMIAKIALRIAIVAFDLFYNWIDTDNDGCISKDELLGRAKIIDKKSRDIVKKLKK